ncbi:MAG: hypothetical protein F9B45_03170 [Phycisphaera sp. RhM]|nr:hypothetical protein [Phycisphaera sp. RhM]
MFYALATALSDWTPTRQVQPASVTVPRRVLVVEDSMVNQLVVKSFLTNEGHEVTIAETPRRH